MNNYVFFADGFEEVEALTTVDIMRRAGMPVVTVSINAEPCATGAHQVTVKTDTTIDRCDFSTAEWLILPGGMPGASNLMACPTLVDALLAHDEKGGKIAAICASPSIILGPLGLLDEKDATCYPGMESGMIGAHPVDDFVAVSGNITTGKGPAAAAEFALSIVEQTLGATAAGEVAKGMLLR